MICSATESLLKDMRLSSDECYGLLFQFHGRHEKLAVSNSNRALLVFPLAFDVLGFVLRFIVVLPVGLGPNVPVLLNMAAVAHPASSALVDGWLCRALVAVSAQAKVCHWMV